MLAAALARGARAWGKAARGKSHTLQAMHKAQPARGLSSGAGGAPDKPKLHYFAFRGRALACRVALFNSLGREGEREGKRETLLVPASPGSCLTRRAAGWEDQRVSLPRFKKAPKPAQNPDRLNAEYITNNLPQLDLPCGSKVRAHTRVLTGFVHVCARVFADACGISVPCARVCARWWRQARRALTNCLQVSQSHAIARFAAKLRPTEVCIHMCTKCLRVRTHGAHARALLEHAHARYVHTSPSMYARVQAMSRATF